MMKEYEMSEEQLNELRKASDPITAMLIGGVAPKLFWEQLGDKMGFDYMTVEPVLSKGLRYFTAMEVEEYHQDEHPEAEDEYQPCEEEIQMTYG